MGANWIVNWGGGGYSWGFQSLQVAQDPWSGSSRHKTTVVSVKKMHLSVKISIAFSRKRQHLGLLTLGDGRGKENMGGKVLCGTPGVGGMGVEVRVSPPGLHLPLLPPWLVSQLTILRLGAVAGELHAFSLCHLIIQRPLLLGAGTWWGGGKKNQDTCILLPLWQELGLVGLE